MYYQQAQQNTQQPAPQIQNGGFVMVKDVREAMSYPIAPGNSVTFKDENKPYIYTKTLGFSQLDQPIFEVFKLVKEEHAEAPTTALEETGVQFFTIDEGNALKTDIDTLKDELNELKAELTELKHELGGDVSKEVVSA
jgi:spore germination protein YaaH